MFRFHETRNVSATMPKYQANAVPRAQAAINQLIGVDFPPGPHCVPWYVIISLQKGGTLPFVLGLMWYFDNYSVSACFYAAAHGSYGLIWLLKHCVGADPKCEPR
ncbi:hypothetical protein EMIHUDRAFT_220150 [Emiliania huxleyi CCMP1516]|uniref:Uncharacterized protein n=2 Tax=Emiliania huxleyi TaxID=2903 RepID=A0A0D3I339_EMIH1|nr:hypothetical protein EMIHUDRAFT_220150 [Emiliania huxleyi CCMP1516]EOD05674.1 hypothetical protein EMIHUDRAFT_220150 [Emiliania huxleyi CCMP1516]|eukprot:XP_005758103.1 hypothetical protein EMIHUDRAFT_220150 [Emiliania huxleyi CCMP1516]